MNDLGLTPAQRDAIDARGNVLVVAGAGTGKTRTLVERCLSCLLAETPRISIDEVLMVTFTEAAAAEMRRRIRRRLEEECELSNEPARWQEQLALFETAHIGTLHSFCLQLVRQHFYQLELDPQLSVLAEDQTRLLADETLDSVLKKHYSRRSPDADAVQALIQAQGRGWDKPIRQLVWRLHQYSQSLPDPNSCLNEQLALFGESEPLTWRQWLSDAIKQFAVQWQPALDSLSATNPVAAQSAAALGNFSANPASEALTAGFRAIHLAKKACAQGKKTSWVDPLKSFFAEAAFLGSLINGPNGADPLAEDWSWVRGHMTALLKLAREFSESFAEAKRELGVLDFQDLEQYSLRLLWDQDTRQPSAIARSWQQKLRFIFVDEYQDINAAQDGIIQALARDRNEANRFLVGDVKQSIYRFRLANPRIFQSYADQWSGDAGRAISLVENFRSRESLLNFINSFFELLGGSEIGMSNYRANAALKFGAPGERAQLGVGADPEPVVEFHLLTKGKLEMVEENGDQPAPLAEVIELQEAEQEAWLAGLQLREMHRKQRPIWDLQTRQFRPVDWQDMALLLRAPAKKAERYARAFGRLGVPLQVARAGFYQSIEIADLLNLLQLLDNPLQDLPLLAVLHSPLVGLTASELAEIRLKDRQARFWTALMSWNLSASGDLEMRRKIGMFLQRFERWRRLARRVTLSRCLEAILAETHYPAWLLTQPRGSQRRANVQRLIALAQDFDQFQRQGLFRFLRFVEAQKEVEAEPEIPTTSTENAVRLMSIHQSKGLEFPLVVLADIGKLFNLTDVRGEIILDEEYGLCPQIKPPHTGKRYPSLPYWLARQRQTRELLGEELRLLYVAMTRARDALLFTGTVPEKKLEALWRAPFQPNAPLPPAARSYGDWLGLWFSQHVPADAKAERLGKTALFRWFIHDPASLANPDPAGARQDRSESERGLSTGSDAWRALVQRLSFQYPFVAATQQPAKTSVSALRHSLAPETDDEEAAPLPNISPQTSTLARFQATRFTPSESKLSASEIGTAHHEFLRLVSLDRANDADSLKSEAHRLLKERRLTAAQVAVLDFAGLSSFWGSELGVRIRAHQHCVHRELAFTARFSPAELSSLLSQINNSDVANEFVLVQGVADLVLIEPSGICLLDFKTDQLARHEVPARVKMYEPQLRLYASALSRIYRRPVCEAWLYWLALRRADALKNTAFQSRGA
jgi:ATP-dependent helicase/nuclease subunit A